ncbi:MAG: stalk domain-containing protein [Clostridia bacterium]|nr:stalk domain-containing protein [Clostridia bacterium]
MKRMRILISWLLVTGVVLSMFANTAFAAFTWTLGGWYATNDVVSFDGNLYKCTGWHQATAENEPTDPGSPWIPYGPSVTSVSATNSNGSYKAGDVISITLDFTQAVNVTGTPQLALNCGGTANYSSGTGTATLTFSYTVQVSDNVSDLNYSSTNALSLNGGSMKDSSNNNASLALPATDNASSLGGNKNIALDNTPPTVSSVSSTAVNGTYKVGDLIPVTVQFPEPVNITGTPQLALNTGDIIDYISGGGTSTLTFNYTVGVGDNTSDLNYLATNSLTLNGGTIKDAANHDADLTLPATVGAGSLGANKDIIVDGIAPTVNNVTSPNLNGTYKVGDSISITVTFTESVTVTGTPQLSLNTGKTVNYVSGSGTNTLTFNYTVGAGDITSDLNYANTGSLMLNGGSIKDAAGNNAGTTLPALAAAGSLGTNKAIVVDGVAPTVINVTSSNGNGSYKAGDVIGITVTLSDPVVVTGTPQISVNTGKTVNYSSGSGTDTLTFNYTVGAGDSAVDLNYVNSTSLVLNSGTIKDEAGNNAVLTLPAVDGAGALGTNRNIVIDTGAPQISNVTSANGNGTYKIGDIIGITVHFQEPVNVTGTPQLVLNTGRTVNYTSGTGSSILTFNYTVSQGDLTSDLNYSNVNALTLNGGTIRDAAGNDAVLTLPAVDGAGALATNKNIAIDGSAPSVSSVTASNGNGRYRAGDVITIQVVFDQAVSVTGTPQLALNTGRTVNYSSGSGSNSLTFTYTVGAGDSVSDLNYTNTGALILNGGTIRDTAGNDAVLTLPEAAGAGSLGTNKDIVIDTLSPNVENVTSPDGNGNYKTGDVILVTVQFNEAVNVTGTPQLTLNTGRTINLSSGNGTNTLTFSYTVQTGDTAADLNYADTGSLILNGGSIKDLAGNDAVLTLPGTGGAGSLGTNKNISIDGAVPNVLNVSATNSNGAYKTGQTVAITIKFNETVYVTGSPRLSLNTGRTADYSSGTGSDTLVFNYVIQAGDWAVDLNYVNTGSLNLNGGTIRDTAGNDAALLLALPGGAGSLGTNKDIAVDGNAATVSYVTSASSNGTYKLGDTIPIHIKFDEAVNVSGTPQLVLNTGRTVNYTGGSGSDILVFNYIVGSGETTAELNYVDTGSLLLNGGTIRDAAGNDAVLTLPAAGGADSLAGRKDMGVDGVVPGVNNVTSTTENGSYKAGNVIVVTLSFSKNVIVTGTPQLSLNTGRVVNYSSGSGTNTLVFNYTVGVGDTATDLNYSNINALILNGGTIKDAAGNDAGLALPATGGAGSLGTNKDIVVDTTAPGIQNVTSTNLNATYKAGDMIAVTLRFSENVTVTGTPRLSLNTGRVVNYSSGSGTDTLTFNYTVGSGDTAADLNYAASDSLALNGGTIKDSAGNDAVLSLPDPGGAGSLGTNKDIGVDGAVPTVNQVASTSGNGAYKLNDTVIITVRFSEAVNVTGTPQITMNTGRTVNYSGGTGTNTLSFDYVVGANDFTSDLNYSNTGSLIFNGGTIRDNAGNDAVLVLPAVDAAGSLGVNKDISVDGAVPEVTGASSTAPNGTYKTGDIIPITVLFGETVHVTGTPQLALNTGRTVNYSSGSGSSTLTFNYTVLASDATTDLNYVAANSLTLNGGTVKDTAGNNAVLTLPAVGGAGSLGTNKDIAVDAVNPEVDHVSSLTPDGTYSAGASIAVTVTFNENVVVTGSPQLALNTGRNAVYGGGSGTNVLTFNYTVLSGDVAGDLDYSATTSLILNGGTIKDGAGNNAVLTLAAIGSPNSLGGAKAIVISAGTSGVLYGDIDNAPLNVNLTREGTEDWAHWGLLDENSFNHKNGVPQKISDAAVMGAGVKTRLAGSTVLAAWTDGNPTANGAAIDSGIYVTGAGNGLSFTVPAGTQQKTLRVFLGASGVRGKVEAILSDGSSSDYINFIDTVGTTYKVLTLTYKAQNPGETLTVKYTVEAMHDEIGGRLVLQAASLASPIITKVTSSIQDGSYKLGAVIPITVKFSGIVNVTGNPRLMLNTGSGADYSGGTGTDTLTFTYTVQPGDNASDLDYTGADALDLNGGSIQDAGAGDVYLLLPDQGWPDSLGGSKDIVIDTTVPSINGGVTSSKADGTYKLGDVIDIRIRFSEPVTVTGTPQLELNTGRMINYSSGSGSDTLIFNYTVQSGDVAADLNYAAVNALTLNGGTIQDSAENDANVSLPATNGAGALAVNKELYVDGQIPAVSQVTSDKVDGTYKLGQVVDVKVVFTEIVTVTGIPQITLNTGRTVTYSSGSGTDTLLFNYTVETGDSTGDLNYTATDALALNGGSIKDAAGNIANIALPAVAGAGSLGTNKSIIIDGVVPMVSNVTSDDGNATYKLGNTISVKIVFNDSVNVTGTPQLAINTGRTLNYTGGSGTNTLLFSYTVGAGDSTSDLNYVSTASLSLNGGTIKDGAGNDADLALPAIGGAGSLGTNKNIAVDGIIPTISGVTSNKSNGIYKAGTIIDIRVNFTEAVSVTGTPQITLNTGVVVDYASGSGSSTLVFNYTVQPGDTAADLNYTAINALSLNGGSIKDGADNDGDITLPLPLGAGSLGTGKDLQIDTTAPDINGGVTSNRANGTYKIGDVIDIRISFSEAVTVTGTPGLLLNTGRVINYSSGSGSSVLVFNYTVGAGDLSPDLNYSATDSLTLNGGTIKDGAGNDAVLTLPVLGGNSLGTNKDIAIDGVVPAVNNVTSDKANGTYKAGDVIDIKVVFNKAVTVTGTPQLSLNTGRVVNYGSGSGTNTLVFNYTVGTGDSTSDLNYTAIGALTLNGGTIQDTAGNSGELSLPALLGAGSLGTNKNLAIDTSLPGVSHITSDDGNASYKLGSTIGVKVVFSEAVNVTGTPQLAVNTGRILNYTGGSGTDTLLFSYTVGAGDSTSDLNYVSTGSLSLNGGTIKDGAGNDADLTLPAIGGAGSLGTNKNIAVDGVIPTISGVTSNQSNGIYKAGTTIDIRVNFTEAVSVTGTPQITLNTGAVVDYASGSGSSTLVFNYTVQPGDTAADLNYTAINALSLNGGSIKDGADNDGDITLPLPLGAGSLGTGKDLQIDTTAPDINGGVTSNKANGTYKIGDVIDIRISFSEAVTVTGTPGLLLNIGRVVNYSSGSGSSVLVFNYTVGAGDLTPDLNYSATDSLTLNGGSIKDGAGNDAVLTLPVLGGNSLGTNKEIAVDGVVPAVNNVTSDKANGTYKAGDVIDIKVVFNKAVTVTGTPQLSLNTGRVVNYSSGSGTNTLVFNYTVGTGDWTADLNYTAVSGLALNGGTVKDGAGNDANVTLPATGAPESLGGGKNIGVDGIIPIVTNITSDSANGKYREGDSVDIKVTFSEAVTVTGTPVILLNTGSTVDYTSGSGSTVLIFRYTVAAGDVSLDLGYANANALSGTIQDVAQNNANLSLPVPGILGSLSFNKDISVDTLAPRVVNVTSDNGNRKYKEGENIDIKVVFDEPVIVTGVPELTLNTGRTVDYTSGSGSSTLIFRYTVGTGDTVNELDYAAFNSLTGVIEDEALNNAVLNLPVPGAAGSLAANKDIGIDTAEPQVIGVSSDIPNGIYRTGQSIDIKVLFTEPVNVTGVPVLALNVLRTASYASGNGTDTLIFRYTVNSGDTSADLDYVGTDSLTGTMKDAAQNAADLTLPLPGAIGSLGGSKNIEVDSSGIPEIVVPVPPPGAGELGGEALPVGLKAVQNVTSDKENGTYKAGEVIDIKVSFNEPVSVSGIPELSLNSGSIAYYVSGAETDTLIFRYHVKPGDEAEELDYAHTKSLTGSIKGLSKNDFDLTLPVPGEIHSLGANKNLAIDTKMPKVVNVTSENQDGLYNVKDVIDIKIKFSEIVKVREIPSLELNTGRKALYISGMGTSSLVFRYVVQEGDAVNDLDYKDQNSLKGMIMDLAENAADLKLPEPGTAGSLGKNENLSVGTQEIKIIGVSTDNKDGVYRKGDKIDIEVLFDSPVKVTGTPKLYMNTGHAAEYISGSESEVLTFRYEITGDDDIQDLNYMNTNALLLSGGEILSLEGKQKVRLTLPSTGAMESLGGNTDITLDGTMPKVTNVSSLLVNGAYKKGATIPVIVTFNENVTVTGKPQLALNTGKKANYGSGSGSKNLIFNYIVQEGESTPDLNYTSTSALTLSGGSIRDKAFNNAVLTLAGINEKGSLGTNKNIVIDTTQPKISDVSIARSADVMIVKVKFTEPIQVSGNPKVLLNKGREADFVKRNGTQELVFNYKIKPGDRDIDLKNLTYATLDLDSGKIEDAAKNMVENEVQKRGCNVEIVLHMGDSSMYVNGVKKDIDPGYKTGPVIVNNRTIIPLRAIVETIGGTVEWDKKTRKATFRLEDKTVEIWLGLFTVRQNGVTKVIDVAPRIVNSRTMMPLRFVAEGFGCDVQWDGDAKKITIRY